MKKTDNEIAASLKEAGQILRGERPPARAWKVEKNKDGTMTRVALDPATIQARNKAQWEAKKVSRARAAMGLTQKDFAGLLGVSIDTLQNWEQGRREPTGAAKVLLRVAIAHPEIVLKAAA